MSKPRQLCVNLKLKQRRAFLYLFSLDNGVIITPKRRALNLSAIYTIMQFLHGSLEP